MDSVSHLRDPCITCFTFATLIPFKTYLFIVWDSFVLLIHLLSRSLTLRFDLQERLLVTTSPVSTTMWTYGRLLSFRLSLFSLWGNRIVLRFTRHGNFVTRPLLSDEHHYPRLQQQSFVKVNVKFKGTQSVLTFWSKLPNTPPCLSL